jgi:FAD/FMN-containing dehydrogenase
MPWAGASSIQNGVQIDMVNMHSVTLSADKTVASILPGARWLEVYDTLTPLGYAVAGGRDSTVGVGGLVIGGGKYYLKLY